MRKLRAYLLFVLAGIIIGVMGIHAGSILCAGTKGNLNNNMTAGGAAYITLTRSTHP